MKKLLFLAAALSAACAASAQGYYTDAYNPDITRHTGRIAAQRAEFILPEVNGYNVYKADLHTHSVYSDGDCTPEFRVREAWYDGPGRAGDHRTRGIPPPRRQDAELPQRLRSRRYGGHKQQHHPEERRRTGHPVGSEPPGETGPGDRPKIRSDDHSRRRDHPRTDRLRPLQRPFHHGQQLPLRHRRPAIAPQRQGAGGAGDAQPSGLAAQEPRTPRVRSQSLRRRADRRHRNYERRRVLPQSHRTRPRPQTVRCRRIPTSTMRRPRPTGFRATAAT